MNDDDSRLGQMGVLGKELTGLASGCNFEEKWGNEESRTMSRVCIDMWVGKSQHKSFSKFSCTPGISRWQIPGCFADETI